MASTMSQILLIVPSLAGDTLEQYIVEIPDGQAEIIETWYNRCELKDDCNVIVGPTRAADHCTSAHRYKKNNQRKQALRKERRCTR
jgi:hypothetical protein